MRSLKLPLRAAPLVALIIAAAGCTSSEPTGPSEVTVADLAGLWMGNSFSVTSQANPALRMDLVELGGNMNWAVQTTGSFTGTAVLPGALLGMEGSLTIPLSGVMRLSTAETLRIDFVPEIPPFFVAYSTTFTLSGNALTLVDEGGLFDFTGDGQQEPATVRATFSRN